MAHASNLNVVPHQTDKSSHNPCRHAPLCDYLYSSDLHGKDKSIMRETSQFYDLGVATRQIMLG
ncbi:hypothetical protein JCM31185_16720 [Furfurilactobacillus curtus]|uniref:Uncharacterized protein n=1 Tax=Furfurilactobacillus curtus TaxID=1746200 RepID=A0ABQ5JQ54_9LACO